MKVAADCFLEIVIKLVFTTPLVFSVWSTIDNGMSLQPTRINCFSHKATDNIKTQNQRKIPNKISAITFPFFCENVIRDACDYWYFVWDVWMNCIRILQEEYVTWW